MGASEHEECLTKLPKTLLLQLPEMLPLLLRAVITPALLLERLLASPAAPESAALVGLLLDKLPPSWLLLQRLQLETRPPLLLPLSLLISVVDTLPLVAGLLKVLWGPRPAAAAEAAAMVLAPPKPGARRAWVEAVRGGSAAAFECAFSRMAASQPLEVLGGAAAAAGKSAPRFSVCSTAGRLGGAAARWVTPGPACCVYPPLSVPAAGCAAPGVAAG